MTVPFRTRSPKLVNLELVHNPASGVCGGGQGGAACGAQHPFGSVAHFIAKRRERSRADRRTPLGPSTVPLSVAGGEPWAPQWTHNAQIVPGIDDHPAHGLPRMHLGTICYLDRASAGRHEDPRSRPGVVHGSGTGMNREAN